MITFFLVYFSLKFNISKQLILIFLGSQFFKDLFAKKQEKVTTAYISANPTHAGINAEIVTDWNRNGQTAADLAYNAYATLPQNI